MSDRPVPQALDQLRVARREFDANVPWVFAKMDRSEMELEEALLEGQIASGLKYSFDTRMSMSAAYAELLALVQKAASKAYGAVQGGRESDGDFIQRVDQLLVIDDDLT